MKKIFICVVGLICFLSCQANAQYAQGDKLLNLGIGVNLYYSGDIPFSAPSNTELLGGGGSSNTKLSVAFRF
jgi:hypothetical protein